VNSVTAPDKGEKRLAQRFSEAIRERHYSWRTEKAYWYWIRCFIFFMASAIRPRWARRR
jgi:hypothetical protein